MNEIPTLEGLAAATAEITKRLSPVEADTFIAAERGRFRAKFTFDGTLVAPEDAERRFEDDARIRYDRDLVARVLETDQQITRALADVDQQLEKTRQPPREANAMLDELRQMNLRSRFEGRTLADLVREYAITEDAANPTLIRMVERERDTFRLKADPKGDANAAVRLADWIKLRQELREPAHLRKQREDLIAMQKSATLSAVVEYARNGTLNVATARSLELRQRLQQVPRG